MIILQHATEDASLLPMALHIDHVGAELRSVHYISALIRGPTFRLMPNNAAWLKQ